MAFIDFGWFVNPCHDRTKCFLISGEKNVDFAGVTVDGDNGVAIFLTVIVVRSCHLKTAEDSRNVRVISGIPLEQDNRILQAFFGETFSFRSIHADMDQDAYRFQSVPTYVMPCK